MPLPEPEPGLVISYSYLWHREAEGGSEEGRKDRPCVIIAVEQRETTIVVSVVPLTHRPPDGPGSAVTVPPIVKRRLGLDDSLSWVAVTEANRFVWPGPDLRPVSRSGLRFDYGFVPPRLYLAIRNAYLARGRSITRSS